MVATGSREQRLFWGISFCFNTGSGNGLLPDGTKPLPEPMLKQNEIPQNNLIGLTLYIMNCFSGNMKYICISDLFSTLRRDILHNVRPAPVCPFEEIPLLLMTWRCKEPGHLQLWYWPNSPSISQSQHQLFNTLRPRQNCRYFADDIFKCIFLNENVWISLKISLKFIPKGSINNIPALVQIMAWRRPGDKPLSEPMMVSLIDAYMRHSASMS